MLIIFLLVCDTLTDLHQVLDEITDALEALSLLKSVLDKVKLHPEAKGLCLSAIALCYLTNNEVTECKERLQEAQELLESSDMEVIYLRPWIISNSNFSQDSILLAVFVFSAAISALFHIILPANRFHY